jgi:hypothetical protein
MKTPENSRGEKGLSTLSKKRYAEIEERVRMIMEGGQGEADDVMQAICEVMRFDPSVPKYCEERREKLVENQRKWRQRKKEEKEKGRARVDGESAET